VGAGANTISGLIINRFVGDGNPGSGNGIGITSSDTIRGNFIGTDASGTVDLGNAGSGIVSPSGFSSTIGGSTDADANLVSGNNADGIVLSNSNTNLILGNLIGTRANGTSGLGNSGAGISLTGFGSGFNTIGGENPGEGNTIAFNGGDGVSLTTAGSGNSIRGNSIFSNGTTNLHLGIDLGADGVTANDAPASLDADSGPNGLQNFPVITLAQVTGSTRTITGTLNSTAGDTFTIDFYQSTACDNSGNGEGKTYLGSLTTDPTDASGNVSFTFHPSVLTVGTVGHRDRDFNRSGLQYV
jgi:parallel beta-helix repeat protein